MRDHWKFAHCLVGFVAVALLGGTSWAKDDVTTIRLASWGGPNHVDLVTFVPTFISEVEKRSEGKIKVKYFPGGALGDDKDMPTAIPAGTVDMSWITINGWSGIVSDVRILDSPACSLGMDELARAIDMPGGFKEIIGRQFEAKGVKLLAWDDLGPGAIVSKKEIRVPQDVKGMKVRVYSEGGAKVIAACGGAPTKIAFSEVYLALQRGTVDAAHIGLQGVKSQRAYEVTKHCLIPNGFMGSPVMGYAMNLALFNSLNSKLQDAVLSSARIAELKARKALVESREDLIKEYQAKGMEIFLLTAKSSEYSEWERELEPVLMEARATFSKEIISAIDRAKSKK